MSIVPLSVPPKRLSQSIISSASSFSVNNIEGWDGNDLTASDLGSQHFVVFINDTRSKFEVMEIDPTTIASSSITITKRGLGFDGTETEVAANKLDWAAGTTIVQFGTDVPQLLNNFVDKAREQTISAKKTFSNVITFNKLPFVVVESSSPTSTSHVITKEAYDASSVVLTGAQSIAGVKTFESIAKYDTAKTFTGDNEIITKKYADDLTAAGAANASSTTIGIVRLSIDPDSASDPVALGLNDFNNQLINESERDATPSNDAGKGVKLESDGYLSPAFLNDDPVRRVYTSNDTWSKPAGLKFIEVELVGGGGVGASAESSTNGSSAGAGGGGAGGYVKSLIAASTLGATETVTIGSGGAGSSSGSGIQNGSSGNDTTFTVTGSSTLTAGGGNGASGTGGSAGGGSNGDINTIGSDGASGGGEASEHSVGAGGSGGDSVLGGGGRGGGGLTASGRSNGSAGNNYGGGGGGGVSRSSGSSERGNGGNGASGIIIVTEYYI